MRVYPFARLTLLPFIRLFVREVRGLENLPLKGPYLIAAKHVGPLDGAFIGAAIIPKVNEKLYFIARIAKWGWFWEKVVAERWAGNIPYYHQNPRICLDIARDYLERGKIVGIFPEGVLEHVEQYAEVRGNRARTGVARLAFWTGVPVVPVGIFNLRSGTPWRVIGKTLLHPNTVRITVGKPMTFPKIGEGEMTYDRLRGVTNEIMAEIERITPKPNG